MKCSEHPCDDCAICASGSCCGEGVVDMALPAEGSWAGALFAPLGTLVETADGVCCHACDWVGPLLSRHIREHGLTADQYRATFGLNSRHALMSTAARARYATAHVGLPNGLARWNEAVTPEQRALVHWDRERRTEFRQHNPRYSPDRQRAFAQVRAAGLVADPEKQRALSIVCRLAKRTEDPGSTCPECGTQFCTWTSRAGTRANKATTCLSPECIRAAKSRAGQMSARR